MKGCADNDKALDDPLEEFSGAANAAAYHSKPHCLPTAKEVVNEEVEYASSERAQAITANKYTGFRVILEPGQ